MGFEYVLRRPPLGQVLATAHDMAREHRIISAVGLSDVPVAPALGLCTDEAVNDAPFYVMAFVDGEVLDSPEKAAALATPELALRGVGRSRSTCWLDCTTSTSTRSDSATSPDATVTSSVRSDGGRRSGRSRRPVSSRG